MKMTINASPIVIDAVSGCKLTVKVIYQSDNLMEMKMLEKELKEKIGLMTGGNEGYE